MDLAARAWRALGFALAAGFGAAVVATVAMSRTHYRCRRDAGVWVCPDGVGYFVPTVSIAAAAAIVVLLVFVLLEVRRSDASTLRTLAEWGATLGAGMLGATGLFLLLVGFPLWLVVPYLGVGGLVFAVRGHRTNVFAVVVAAGVAVCLSATAVSGFGFALTTPALMATAGVWATALALRLVPSFDNAP